MVVGPSPRLPAALRHRVAAKAVFDHEKGVSRSHRDTEKHENEIGTAITANSDGLYLSPWLGEAKTIELGVARERATTPVLDSTSIAPAV
jgi:hypothetical protein